MREEELMTRMAIDMLSCILERDTRAYNKILASVITRGPRPCIYFVSALIQGIELFSGCMTKYNSENRKIVRTLVRAMRDGDSNTDNNFKGQYYDDLEGGK